MGGDPTAMGPGGPGAAPGSADPTDAFFGDLFGDAADAADAADMAGGDPSAFLAAMGGGAAPAAPSGTPPGLEGLPITQGPNGQPLLMTSQGALPVVPGAQGPMAVTQNGPVPLQALSGLLRDDFQAKAAAVQAARTAQVAQALSQAASKAAMASAPPRSASPSPAPYSGRSSFVPSSPSMPTRSAPVPTRSAPVASRPSTTTDSFQAPAVKDKSPVVTNRPEADPKLDQKAGIGTRIGTTGTGDGNLF